MGHGREGCALSDGSEPVESDEGRVGKGGEVGEGRCGKRDVGSVEGGGEGGSGTGKEGIMGWIYMKDENV